MFQKQSVFYQIVTYIVLVLISLIMLVPLIWLIPTSLKSQQELFSFPLSLRIREFRFANFTDVWNRAPFGRYYVNTVIIVTSLILVQIVIVSLAAYAFARVRFPGRDTIFMIILIQLMITAQVTVLPNYITMMRLNLLDTKAAVMLPYATSAFGIFLMRQAFKIIPVDMEHAAIIDGCNRIQFLVHVAIPLVKASLLAFCIASITFHWNEFFWPLIITDTSRARTLTVGLSLFAKQSEGAAEWTLLMAATVIVCLPLIVVFFIFQRAFVDIHMRSGVK